jgi:hypothetical protein
MGQYHFVCNLDKHQFLHPHQLGDGLKLMEFGNSAGGTLTALAILLASANGRGGGDLMAPEGPPEVTDWFATLVGSWAGDRIAIIGDYFEPGDILGWDIQDNPWNDKEGWEDISAPVRALIEADGMFVFEPENGGMIRRLGG